MSRESPNFINIIFSSIFNHTRVELSLHLNTTSFGQEWR
jgi:hypothetical protein